MIEFKLHTGTTILPEHQTQRAQQQCRALVEALQSFQESLRYPLQSQLAYPED